MADNNPLGYAPDYGVEHFKVNLDYQVLDKINLAGPAPNAVYGRGNWVTVLSASLFTDNFVTPVTSATAPYKVDISVGTRGVNGDLPGLGTGALDVNPLSVTITNTSPTASVGATLQFAAFYVDFVVNNPTACKWSPRNNVHSLVATRYGATENITTTPAVPSSATSVPTSGIYPYPYATYQNQPYISLLDPTEVKRLKDKSTVANPFFGKNIDIWRLWVPVQYLDASATTFTTITVLPDVLNYSTPIITAVPYTINVNADGFYGN